MKKSVYYTAITVIILLLACQFVSCRSTRYVPVKVGTDSIVVEKLVEVPLPPDSSTIRALLECDENGKVVLNWLDIANSKNAQAQLTIDSLGNLLAKMKTRSDTIFLPSKTITVKEKEPYPVEKELTGWEKFKMQVGKYAIGLTGLAIISTIIYFFVVKK